MKKAFTVLSLVCLASFAFAQQKNTTNIASDAGSLKLQETEFNFGKIPQGKPVNHIFNFTNSGKEPLLLENVVASCGCTTPEWKRDTVPAGGSSLIKVGYNAAAEGPFSKLVTVSYNGGHTAQITITGEVWKTPATSAPLNTALNTFKNEQ